MIKPDIKLVIVVKGEHIHYERETSKNLSLTAISLAIYQLEKFKLELLDEFEPEPDYEIEDNGEDDDYEE